MQVWTYIVEWDRVRLFGEWVDEDWVASDSYTHRNDSAIFNSEVGELYREMRDRSTEEDATSLGTFLTAFSIGGRIDVQKLLLPLRPRPSNPEVWISTRNECPSRGAPEGPWSSGLRRMTSHHAS